MEHISIDTRQLPSTSSSKLQQQQPIKKKQNINVDLPTLHEDIVFDPHSGLDSGPILYPNVNSKSELSKQQQTDIKTQRDRKMNKRSFFISYNPPNWLRRLASLVYRHTGGVATYLVFFLLIYTLLWIFSGEEALPPRCYAYLKEEEESNGTTDQIAVCYGGTMLSIVLFYATAFAVGQLVELVRLPGLLGMLLSGLILRCIGVFITSYDIFIGGPPLVATVNNTPTSNLTAVLHGPLITFFAASSTDAMANVTRRLTDPLLVLSALMKVKKELSSALRQIALATILTRAGLGLEPATLRRVWTSMIRLTCLPCLTEALVCMVISKFLMGWPWPWAAMMGFILAAVSPAVVVPNMLRLEIAGWGVTKGIPTIIMAASSLDDVLAITGFGISQTIAFAQGDIAIVAISGPLEVLAGACLGVCLAIVLWLLPLPGMEHSNSLRCALLYSISVAAITGTIKMGLPGAGALCCLVCSLTCSAGWQHGMPWRFKRSSLRQVLPSQTLIEGDSNDADFEINQNNSKEIRQECDSTAKEIDTVSTAHHEYYQQHLRSLKRLLKETGEEGSRKALATVTKSRRFSLPEPKPQYEEIDFEEMLDFKQRLTYLNRSFSVSRSYSTTTSESARPVIIEEGIRETVAKEDSPLVTEVNEPSGAAEDRAFRISDPEKMAALLELDKAKGLECLRVMRSYMATCWWFVQPLLFCLIGAGIPVEKLRPDTIGLGIASILISIVSRMGASILAVTPSPLNWKERVFVAVAWIPKATVQAAIGPLALDSARATGDPNLINWGEQIITLSALSILFTAPLAALLIPLVAPYLLQQNSTEKTNAKVSDGHADKMNKNHSSSKNKAGLRINDGKKRDKARICNKSDGILRREHLHAKTMEEKGTC